MTRLYNEYAACPKSPDTDAIDRTLRDALKAIWEDNVDAGSLDPRDLMLYCINETSLFFSERILIRAMDMLSRDRFAARETRESAARP